MFRTTYYNIYTKSVCNLQTYVWILSRTCTYKNILQRERPITEKEKNLSGPINSFLIKNFHLSRVDNRMSRFVDDMPTNHPRTDERYSSLYPFLNDFPRMHRKCKRMFFVVDKPYPDARSFTNFPRNDRNRTRSCLKQKTDKGLDEE